MRKIAVWGALFAVLGFVTTSYSEEFGLEFRDRPHNPRIASIRPMITETVTVVVASPEPLPADALALVTSFDSESATIRQKAEQEIQAKRQSLIVTLQALQDAYTREAKLDEAVAIRDTIRQLKVSHLKPAPDPGSLSEYANRIGETFYFDVTGQVGYSIWGSEVYTADSHLATAAVHAGVLKVGQRGIVKVTLIKSPDTHRGSTANGVSSSNWGNYGTSYTVERPNFDSMPPLRTKPATP
ncbi:MAG: hypothetical protein JWP89_6454 [Schlesneria sp.]|nr:hypothetical protein [Schlesneria sp.]